MKSFLSITMSAMIALVVFYSCSSEDAVVNGESSYKEAKDIVITATDFESENHSRTTLKITNEGASFSWAATDTIGIFPDEGAQAYFPMVSGAGTKTASFTGGGWALKSSSEYMAYYPYNFFNRSKDKIKVSFEGQISKEDGSVTHLGAYDYMAAKGVTATNGAVNFNFNHLNALVRVKIKSPVEMSIKSVTLVTEDESFTIEGIIDLSQENIVITPTKLSDSLTIQISDYHYNIQPEYKDSTMTIYFMLPPTDLSEKKLTARIIDDYPSAYGDTIDVNLSPKNFEAGMTYELVGDLMRSYHVEEAGTLPSLIAEEEKYHINAMKVSGKLNGTDVKFIREMLGCEYYNGGQMGTLRYLDMGESSIVSGGEPYYYENVTEDNIVGDWMFWYCQKLEYINLPQGIIRIGNNGVSTYNAHGLYNRIYFPETVTSLGESCIVSYSNGYDISPLPNVTTIATRTFSASTGGILCLKIPNVTKIESEAFECDVNTVIFGEKLSLIEEHAFYRIPRVVKIYAKNPPTLEDNAFYPSDEVVQNMPYWDLTKGEALWIPQGSYLFYSDSEWNKYFENIYQIYE